MVVVVIVVMANNNCNGSIESQCCIQVPSRMWASR